MPLQSNVTPPSGYKPAGSFNKDMKAPSGNKTKTSQGLNGGSMTESKTGAPKKGMDYSMSKMANFTTDQDMGLKSNMGKSGKY